MHVLVDEEQAYRDNVARPCGYVPPHVLEQVTCDGWQYWVDEESSTPYILCLWEDVKDSEQIREFRVKLTRVQFAELVQAGIDLLE